MFFYVFLDPETISDASADQGDLGRLIDVLRSMEQGCLMAETDLWRVDGQLKEKIKEIPFQMERKMIGDLLIHLWQKGPLVVMDNDDFETPLVDFAIANAARDSLDLILTPRATESDAGLDCEISGLQALHATQFSQARHNLGAGLSFPAASTSGEELFSRCFLKLIRQAQQITIVDYALGEYYGNDHPANLRSWVLWIDENLKNPERKTLIIRTVAGQGHRSLENQIDGLRHEVDLTLKLETVPSKDLLPHRRFLVADQTCLDIDRGIDICDAKGKCRRVDITYANRPR